MNERTDGQTDGAVDIIEYIIQRFLEYELASTLLNQITQVGEVLVTYIFCYNIVKTF